MSVNISKNHNGVSTFVGVVSSSPYLTSGSASGSWAIYKTSDHTLYGSGSIDDTIDGWYAYGGPAGIGVQVPLAADESVADYTADVVLAGTLYRGTFRVVGACDYWVGGTINGFANATDSEGFSLGNSSGIHSTTLTDESGTFELLFSQVGGSPDSGLVQFRCGNYEPANFALNSTKVTLDATISIDWGDGSPIEVWTDSFTNISGNFGSTQFVHAYSGGYGRHPVQISWSLTDSAASCTFEGTCEFVAVSYDQVWRCRSGNCYDGWFGHLPLIGFDTEEECHRSGCSPDQYRYVCGGGYGCVEVASSDQTLGYDSYAQCMEACHRCDYEELPVVVDTDADASDPYYLHFKTTNTNGWLLHVYYRLDGVVQSDPLVTQTGDVWRWRVLKRHGAHQFNIEWSKEDCPSHLVEASFNYTGPLPDWPGPGPYCFDDVSECHALTTLEEWLTAQAIHAIRGPMESCDACAFDGGGDGCCPDFHYFDPDLEHCVLVEVCPQAAPVPVLSNRRGGQVTVSFTGWSKYATSLELLQDGVVVHSFAFADARSFVVTGLVDFATYHFALRGANDTCTGDASASVAVTMVSEHLVLAWTKPTAGQDVTGVLGLIGDVACDIGLAALNPVQMLLNGVALAGTKQFGTETLSHHTTWTNRFDPLGADFLGDLTFRLFARDSLGLAAFVDVRVHASLSLAKLTRYQHDGWTNPTGSPLGQVALVPRLDTREPSGWVDAFVASPGHGGVLPYDDFAAMETELQKWQNVAFDAPFTVLGTKSDANPLGAATERMEIVLRFTPPQLETRHLLNATTVARSRRIDDTTLEVLTLAPARLLEVTPTGVTTLFDISARGLTDVVDARSWRDDKVVVVTETDVWVCEKDGSSADIRLKLSFEGDDEAWHLEERPCVGVETLDATTFYLAFADVSGSHIWKVDGTDPLLVLETSERITLLRAQGERLAFATASHQIRDSKPFTDGGRLLVQHDAAVTELGFDANNDVTVFADDTHLWVLGESGAALAGEVAGQHFRALGWYQGFGTALRLSAGGDGGSIYVPGTGGAFLPVWTVGHGTTAIRALGRSLVTYVEASGNPLMGGTPAINSEVLVALCETGTENGAFVAFIEKSRQNSDTSRRARAVTQLVVVPA